jgi:uncharacterized integral membrane protein
LYTILIFTLILLVILALLFGFFATQNTQTITIVLANANIPDLPLYIVIGATLLIGLAIAWIMSLSDTISSSLKIRGKESTIKDGRNTIHDLTKQINQLEIENAKLKGELKKESSDIKSM